LKSVNELHQGEGLSLSKQWDLRLIQSMQIAESGIDREGDGFIRLRSGELLFSVPAHDADRIFWRENRESLPENLVEDAMSVAWDVAQRYFRENGLGYVLPKSHYLRPGWLFVDLGAYIGFGSVKAAHKVGPRGRVLAVEASAEAFRLLRKNVSANGLDNIYPVHAAAIDEDHEVRFHGNGLQQNSLLPSLEDADTGKLLTFSGNTIIPGRSIDSLIEERGWLSSDTPTFASLEINGGEPDALRGMARLIRTASRIDIRAAARYTAPETNTSCRDQIHQVFSRYDELHVRDCHPYVLAHKYPPGEVSN
jgi:FkbM family methyltransferase